MAQSVICNVYKCYHKRVKAINKTEREKGSSRQVPRWLYFTCLETAAATFKALQKLIQALQFNGLNKSNLKR